MSNITNRVLVATLLALTRALTRYYRRPDRGNWVRSLAYRTERRLTMFLRPVGGPWMGHQTWVYRDGVVRGVDGIQITACDCGCAS